MTEAIFGLLGVIVGALINGGIAAISSWKRTDAEVRAAGLLVTEEIIRSTGVLLGVRNHPVWGAVTVARFGEVAQWETHRATLTRRMSLDHWTTCSSAFGGLEHLREKAAENDPLSRIDDDDGRELARVYVLTNQALSYLGLVTAAPPRWRLLARWRFRRNARDHADKLAADENDLRRDSW